MLRNECSLVIVPWGFKRVHEFPQVPTFSPRMLIYQKEPKEELVKYFELVGVEDTVFTKQLFIHFCQ